MSSLPHSITGANLKGIIVGTGRSGTTLLVNLLGSHSRLSPLYELEFLVDIIKAIKDSGKIDTKEVLGLLYRWGSAKTGLPFKEVWDKSYDKRKPRFGSKYVLFTKPELLAMGTIFLDHLKTMPADQALGGFIRNLVALHCRNDNKPGSILKVPSLLRAPELLFDGLPEVKFVHIYRDGRDVWCSARKFWWGPKTVTECANWWTENLQISDLIRREYPDRILDVKYETLLEQPDALLDKIFRFLGENPEPISYDISKDRVNRYQKEMCSEEIRAFEKIAKSSLKSRGYACLQ